MRLELTGRHVDITPAVRRLVDTRLAKLERLLNDSALSAQAVLTREKNRNRTDITLHARGEKFLHGRGVSITWDASIGQAIDKIAQQAQRITGKWQERKRRGLKVAPREVRPEPAPPGRVAGTRARTRMPKIIRAEGRELVVMSTADAVREIDANRADVVVFRDAETAAISVLYSRNGELMLIEMDR